MKTEVYKNGKIVKTTSYLGDKKFQYIAGGKSSKYDLVAYLNSKLSKDKFDKPGKFYITYSFNLIPSGKLVAPLIEVKSDQQIDSAIVAELLAAPNWEPTIRNEPLKIFLLSSAPNKESDTYNSGEKRLHVPFYLDIIVDTKGKIHISYPEKSIFRYD